jgi:magnesium chelatase family protein
MREEVQTARRRQRDRFTGNPTMVNGRMSGKLLRRVCELDAPGEAILKQSLTELGLSARAHDKILRLSRTIADLAAHENITADDICEAVQYRRLDRKL